MVKADNLPGPAGQSSLPSSVPLLIIGGGIMGLWAAVKAERLGIDTLLVEARHIGSGASGGLLGALMPHMPDRWSDKKQFQFDALLTLEDEIAQLEAETGLSAGYSRCGRIIPLPKAHLRPIAERHREDAAINWDQQGRRFNWHVSDGAPVSGYVSAAAGEAGFVYDTFAARVSPRAFVRLLHARLRLARHVRIVEGVELSSLEKRVARFRNGHDVTFEKAIMAAGCESFPILAKALQRPADRALGQPVKGQSALLQAQIDPSLPVVFLNGLYVVPHENGTVAIGSTSEDQFEEAFSTDDKLEKLVEQASQIVPALAGARVVERWAGLRPKAVGRDPMVGAHPDYSDIIALTGGFKVSFGLAHRLADAALCCVQGKEMDVPESFALQHHLSVLE